jgi:succinylarginine dihydrolase
MKAREFNFDGLVGPTHNYAGLAEGNLASQQNRHLTSHPRAAALQGLQKMKFLADLGVPQVVLPPQPRPDLSALRRMGYGGTDHAVVQKAAHDAPRLLAACYSASAMWAANAATVSPSADAHDGKLHVTPANLVSHFHRSLETARTARTLRRILPGERFVHHEPLPASVQTGDEGAANHSRATREFGLPGIEIFTYGSDGAASAALAGRQPRQACEAIARLHGLSPDRALFVQQNPDAIAAGVFHNDVIAVAHQDIFLHHERAYADSDNFLTDLRRVFEKCTGAPLRVITIPEALLPLPGAVRSYFFNSQLVTLPDGSLAFIAPAECQEIPAAHAAIDFLRNQLPGIAVHFMNVRESMRNGGGPACLRLRVVLTDAQEAAMNPAFRFTPALYAALQQWIVKHYREDLTPHDLADPRLLDEVRAAMQELARLGLCCSADQVCGAPQA